MLEIVVANTVVTIIAPKNALPYLSLAVITRPPDGVLLTPSLLGRLVTRAVKITRRPDGVS